MSDDNPLKQIYTTRCSIPTDVIEYLILFSIIEQPSTNTSTNTSTNAASSYNTNNSNNTNKQDTNSNNNNNSNSNSSTHSTHNSTGSKRRRSSSYEDMGEELTTM